MCMLSTVSCTSIYNPFSVNVYSAYVTGDYRWGMAKCGEGRRDANYVTVPLGGFLPGLVIPPQPPFHTHIHTHTSVKDPAPESSKLESIGKITGLAEEKGGGTAWIRPQVCLTHTVLSILTLPLYHSLILWLWFWRTGCVEKGYELLEFARRCTQIIRLLSHT